MSDRFWIARIEDRELRERVRRVLCDLLLISEGPASAPKLAPTDEERKSKGGMRAKQTTKHFESSVPRGVNVQRGDMPSQDGSLYDWHVWHLSRAVDQPERLLRLCYAAERDAKRAKWSQKDWRRDKDSSTASERQYESEEDLEARILGAYEGMDSVEVAVVYEDRHPVYIEKIRRKHGRNPKDGTVREGWFTWDEEQKVEEIRFRRQERGLSQQKIALELGVSKRAVQTRWPATEQGESAA